MAMRQFGALTSYIRVASSSCVACFVLESRDGMQVVAMGSGTGYYTTEFAPNDPNAEMVMDGHAEVRVEPPFLSSHASAGSQSLSLYIFFILRFFLKNTY